MLSCCTDARESKERSFGSLQLSACRTLDRNMCRPLPVSQQSICGSGFDAEASSQSVAQLLLVAFCFTLGVSAKCEYSNDSLRLCVMKEISSLIVQLIVTL